MSKRYAKGTLDDSPRKKRRLVGSGGHSNASDLSTLQIGAKKREDDAPFPSSANTTPSIYSTRTIHITYETMPSLTTYAARSFADNLVTLYETEEDGQAAREWLKELPVHTLMKVWKMLIDRWPQFLTSAFISACFIRGSSVYLPASLIGVKRTTIQNIGGLGSQLTVLEATGHAKILDKVFAGALSSLPNLEHLNLRGCSLVGSDSAKVLGSRAEHLKYLNLSMTVVPLMDLVPALKAALNLETLKLAGLATLTDLNLNGLTRALFEEADSSLPLTRLQSFKIRHTQITATSLTPFLQKLPLLRRLDVSFIPLRTIFHQHEPLPYPPLEKLSLTSIPMPSPPLLQALSHLPYLKVLNLGALGASAKTVRGHAVGGGDTSGTITDQILYQVTDILADQCHQLQSVSLAGNTLLGRSVQYFVEAVGWKLKILNLGGIPGLKSSDLSPLVRDSETAGQPKLERLGLRNTKIDDEASVYIAACVHLTMLDLESTKVTAEGVLDIIDACEKLESINLTSCRGIKVQERRRFFEVWDKERRHVAASDDEEPSGLSLHARHKPKNSEPWWTDHGLGWITESV